MEVSGELHSLASLTPWKEFPLLGLLRFFNFTIDMFYGI
jgi:hypothetical protein